MLTKVKHQFRRRSLVFRLLFLCSSAALFLVSSRPLSVSAAEYSILKDEKGVFMQTAEHGSWYIDGADLKTFKVGDRGAYLIRQDMGGTYLITDKPGKFYINMEARAKIERDIRETNEKYERDMEELRKEQEKKAAQEKEMKAQKEAQQRAIEAEREAQERALQAKRINEQNSYPPAFFVPNHIKVHR